MRNIRKILCFIFAAVLLVSCWNSEIPVSVLSVKDSVEVDYFSADIYADISSSLDNIELVFCRVSTNSRFNDTTDLMDMSYVQGNSFKLKLDGLTDGTKYYYQYVVGNYLVDAYVRISFIKEDSVVCIMEDDKIRSFTTRTYTGPEVTTDTCEILTDSTALLQGTMVFSTYERIINKGFYFGTDSLKMHTLVSDDLSKTFTCQCRNLKNAATYYYQAFVYSERGVGTGEIKKFKIPD